MVYDPKYFNPQKRGGVAVDGAPDTIAFAWDAGKRRDVYAFEPRVTLAINVAIATERPLLIAGEPGSGKTRLAAAVAEVLEWQFYPRTVTSRTQASDLLWTFNSLGRLNDATGKELRSEQHYVTPGQVWWGLNPRTAAQRGLASLPNPRDAAADPAQTRKGSAGAVVLIDEIDKADPDVPNDLLEPFDVRRFTVKETNETIEAERDVFLVLTTNGERELPPAFLRRCVTLALADPDSAWFAQVARQHFPNGDDGLHQRVAAEVQRLRIEAKPGARKPSTAEFLDALRVCETLKVKLSDREWTDVIDAVLLKREQFAATQAGQRVAEEKAAAAAQIGARAANG
jgi:MoxR-like ATPase